MKTNLEFPDNVSLEFDAYGVYVRVSLNITASLKPFMSPNNVFKGKVYWVYAIKSHIPNYLITKKHIEDTKNDLLTRAMANIRRAKSKHYQSQSDKLSHQLNIFGNDY